MAVCDEVCSRLAAWISDLSVRGGMKRAHLYFCVRTVDETAAVAATAIAATATVTITATVAPFGRNSILVAVSSSPVFCIPIRAAAYLIEICCVRALCHAVPCCAVLRRAVLVLVPCTTVLE